MSDHSGWSRPRARWLLCALLVAWPWSARAQVGQTTDIITGVVVDAQGKPLADVVVEAVSLETEISRTTQTDERGRFIILFPDGGGQYRMTARMVGLAPRQGYLVRHADEDRLVWNVEMSARAVLLDPVEVRGERTVLPVRQRERPTPGAIERNLTTDQIVNLPLDPEDLNVLATLVPGVVPIDATDSTGAAFSVAGQRPDANQITLDGMTFASGQVPQEGVRNTRVITSTYDVSRGRFSGGLIAATTRSGSNAIQASMSYVLRDDALAFESGENSPFTRGFSQHQLGAGVGGPVIRNKLFAFGSGQFRFRTDGNRALTTATTADLQRLSVSADSVERFLTAVNGIGAASSIQTSDDRSNDNVSAMLRVDHLISNNHTLTLRGDWRRTEQDPTRQSALGLPETGGVAVTSGGGAMASLSSRIGMSFINEARVYLAGSRRDVEPYLQVPSGRVQVASQLEDGSTGITTLSFGGNARMPTRSRGTSFEATNELSWLPGFARHRFKIGGSVSIERSTDVLSGNQSGTFTFNSLADLEAGNAASFRRTLAPDERTTHGIDYGVYAGDVWRASRALQVTYGLRVEGSTFYGAPAYNPSLDSLLGIRADRLPSETSLSPRAGFTWMLGQGLFGPDLIVRGGAGRFRSPIPAPLVAQTQISTGLSDSESEINCIGSIVPVPDWQTYAQDPATIPTSCLGGGGVQANARTPNATVFSESYAAAKAWRASLGVQRNLTPLIRLTVDAIYARGTSQYGFRDLNLNTSGGFQLTAEANRPAFVDPTSIAPSTGAVRLTDSRIEPSFGQVLEIGSDLESETKQLSVSLGGITGNGIILQTAYTWSSVRDQSSSSARFGFGGLGAATTAGDPNQREWSRSSYERRHSFLAVVSYPFGTSVEPTAIGRINSGTPYTPLVAGDINGDGARNDRAFVFAPDATIDPALALGMEQLLANASAGARKCLENQLGTIADRNSCTGPWEASFDLQLNYRPRFLGLNGNVTISLVTMNLLRGIDELVHGADGAQGWGLRSRPDQTLLFVNGFDPATNQFSYSVNERFGATGSAANAYRPPFQIGIQVRASLGPNRYRAALDRMRGGGGGRGFGGGRPGLGGRAGGLRGGAFAGGLDPQEFLERFQSLLPNPAAVALELSDSLGLTEPQVQALTVVRDSLIQQTEDLATELRAEIEELGANQDPRGLMQLIRPKLEQARGNVRRSLDDVRDILTPSQWEQLPEDLRNFRAGQGPGLRRRP